MVNFWTYAYISGTNFFTLGYGDITPLELAVGGRYFVFLATDRASFTHGVDLAVHEGRTAV